jgi:hypothetical protein
MSTWEVLKLPELTHEALQALLNNEVGVVTISDFFDQQQRDETYSNLLKSPEWSVYEGSALGRLGITQYEHFGQKDAYLEAAPAAMAARTAVLDSVPDPVDVVMEAFAAAWPGEVGIAEEDDGRRYFAGITRRDGGDGILIHSDWGPRDGADWTIGQISDQLAWNLFLSAPGDGGELIVYDYPWEPELENHATHRAYDYDSKLFESSRRAEVAPESGMLMVFRSKNAHAVAHSPTDTPRVAVGSFIGVTPDGNLAFWS